MGSDLILIIMPCFCAQARNQPRDDLPDESEGDPDGLILPADEYGQTLGAEDYVIFSPDDEESESEDDAWFDELIERKLSGLSDLQVDSQPVVDPVTEAMAAMTIDSEPDLGPVPVDSQALPPHSQVLDLDTCPKVEPEVDKTRPVARPLQAMQASESSIFSPVALTPDKPAYVEIADSPLPLPAPTRKESKQERIARLKAQLEALENDIIDTDPTCGAPLATWGIPCDEFHSKSRGICENVMAYCALLCSHSVPYHECMGAVKMTQSYMHVCMHEQNMQLYDM